MNSQDTTIIQSQFEQILSQHDALERFEAAAKIWYSIWMNNGGRMEVSKKCNRISLYMNCDTTGATDEPSVTFDVSTVGTWTVADLSNSRFSDEDESVNTLEYWECVTRIENFDQGFVESLPD